LDILIAQSSDHFLLELCVCVENNPEFLDIINFFQCFLKDLTGELKLSFSDVKLAELYPEFSLLIGIFAETFSDHGVSIDYGDFVGIINQNIQNLKLEILFGFACFRMIPIVFQYLQYNLNCSIKHLFI
jgi:hypothetical protein